MDDLERICRYMNKHPPAHLLLAPYVGFKSKEHVNEDEFGTFMSAEFAEQKRG